MTFSGGVDFVDRFSSGMQGRVEAEGHFGGQQVLVDGLGHPDHRQS